MDQNLPVKSSCWRFETKKSVFMTLQLLLSLWAVCVFRPCSSYEVVMTHFDHYVRSAATGYLVREQRPGGMMVDQYSTENDQCVRVPGICPCSSCWGVSVKPEFIYALGLWACSLLPVHVFKIFQSGLTHTNTVTWFWCVMLQRPTSHWRLFVIWEHTSTNHFPYKAVAPQGRVAQKTIPTFTVGEVLLKTNAFWVRPVSVKLLLNQLNLRETFSHLD